MLVNFMLVVNKAGIVKQLYIFDRPLAMIFLVTKNYNDQNS